MPQALEEVGLRGAAHGLRGRGQGEVHHHERREREQHVDDEDRLVAEVVRRQQRPDAARAEPEPALPPQPNFAVLARVWEQVDHGAVEQRADRRVEDRGDEDERHHPADLAPRANGEAREHGADKRKEEHLAVLARPVGDRAPDRRLRARAAERRRAAR